MNLRLCNIMALALAVLSFSCQSYSQPQVVLSAPNAMTSKNDGSPFGNLTINYGRERGAITTIATKQDTSRKPKVQTIEITFAPSQRLENVYATLKQEPGTENIREWKRFTVDDKDTIIWNIQEEGRPTIDQGKAYQFRIVAKSRDGAPPFIYTQRINIPNE